MSFKKRFTSARIIILGFAGVILLGALLLMLPISSQKHVVTPFLDCLFTSTSAVCVTGLIVHDTATYWTSFGQFIILLLIQIGGMRVPWPFFRDERLAFSNEQRCKIPLVLFKWVESCAWSNLSLKVCFCWKV